MSILGQDHTVILKDSCIGLTTDVTEAMRGEGIFVRSMMADIGVIFATLDETQATKMRNMEPVLQVEPCKTTRMQA